MCIRIWATAPICASRPWRSATRILFEGKRAVGVEYVQGKEKKTIRARREVILASGAFQSPQLLLLSGVGDSAASGAARHRKRASSARRRAEPAGPSRLRLRLHVRQPALLRHLAERPAAAVPRHRAISPRTARADHLELRRMRRLPEDAARSRQCPTSSCISAWRWSTTTAASATAAPASPAMSACSGRRAAAASASAPPIRSRAPRIDPNFLGEDADLEAMVAGFKTTRRLMETPSLQRTADQGHVHRQT